MSDNIDKIWVSPKNISGEFVGVEEFKRMHETTEWEQMPYEYLSDAMKKDEESKHLREEFAKRERKFKRYYVLPNFE